MSSRARRPPAWSRLPLIGALLLGACGSPSSPSLLPSTPPEASRSPVETAIQTTPSPSALASPILVVGGVWVDTEMPVRSVVSGPDGTVYVSEWEPGGSASAVHRFDASGDELTGWPIEYEGSPTLIMDQDWVLASVCRTDGSRCDLHRITPDGTEEPGWPVRTPPRCFDGFMAWDGVVVLNCLAGSDAALTAVDRAGRTLTGWPITVPNLVDALPAPGGGVIVVHLPRAGIPTIDVLGPDGTSREGWPVALSESAGQYGSFGAVAGPAEQITVWWMEGVVPGICVDAERTRYAALRPDGSMAPGWPVTVPGFGSRPSLADDGRTWFRVDGPRSEVMGVDHRGRALAGWPVELPHDECAGADGSAAVHRMADGRLVVVQDEVLHLFEPGGTSPGGWPIELDGLPADGCLPEACTPGTNQVVPPIVDEAGVLYIPVYRGVDADQTVHLDAFDRRGRAPEGWPQELPAPACPSEMCGAIARVKGLALTAAGDPILIAAEGIFLVGLSSR